MSDDKPAIPELLAEHDGPPKCKCGDDGVTTVAGEVRCAWHVED